MGLILFLLFLATPLIEIAVFIEIGGLLGLWPTIAIVIVTAALGAALWRRQGLAVMAQAQEALNRGELPVAQVMDGAFLLFAGALLLTPGFMTDAFGFLLFVPPFRHALARYIFARLRKSGNVHVYTSHGGGPTDGPRRGSGPVIEGDVTNLDDDRQS